MFKNLFAIKIEEFKRDRLDELNNFNKELEKKAETYRTDDVIQESGIITDGNTEINKLIDVLRRLRKSTEKIHTYICLRQDYNTFTYHMIKRYQKKINRDCLTEAKKVFDLAMNEYEKYLNTIKKVLDGEATNVDIEFINKTLKKLEEAMVDDVINILVRLNNTLDFPMYKAEPSFDCSRKYPTDKKYLELANKVKACETSFPQLITNCRRIDYLEIIKFVSKQNI